MRCMLQTLRCTRLEGRGRLMTMADIAGVIASTMCFTTFYMAAGLYLFVHVVLCLLTWPVDHKLGIPHRVSGWLTFHYLTANPFWRCCFQGLENLPPARPVVYVANHQSLVDILVLPGLLNNFKWVAKRVVFCTPAVGQIMFLSRDIRSSDGTFSDTRRMMCECAGWLSCGVSVLFFSEGTRSPDGQLLPFKSGSFHLACDNNVPVVPIAIYGTRKILAKYSRNLCFQADITVRVFPPVNPEDCQGSAAILKRVVRDAIGCTLAELEREATPAENAARA
jgi:1-acyl-sn-glycerol-3-phosphate acyltransferase